LEFALALAADTQATVDVVHIAAEGVVEPVRAEGQMHKLLDEAARADKVTVKEAAGPDVETVVDGGSVANIVRTVALQKRSDLVVVGRGCIQTALGRLRANAYSIVREAPCPVLSV
jgi:nucleotide-binding universal stress UspA family protein